MTPVSIDLALQRCIEPDCGARFGLNEQLYVCPHCGGLLEIENETNALPDAETLRRLWQSRLASSDERDRSGVWRYRELLPCSNSAPIVSLAEGNTPLYDAPRAARYCGLNALQLKHQRYNHIGSINDTGQTTPSTHVCIT